jgi:transposase
VTIDVRIETEIRRLFYAEHFRMGTIATQLGVHHDVVRRVLGVLAPGRIPPPRPSLVLPFAAFIDDTLRQYPRLCSTRLYDMLCPRGYEGSVRTLREYVATVRPVPRGEAFLRTEPMIGEQAQIDWAHVGKIPVAGGERALWVFVIVLAYSRAIWAELVLEMTAACLRRSLVRASSYFAGATRQWLFDNPKIVVLERHGDAVRFHPGLLELAGVLHVQPRLCGVRKPQQKGRVERAVRYLRDRFFAARTIRSIEQGNRELTEFLEGIALARPHPRWPERRVADVLAEERLRLLKLPDAMPETDEVLSVPVDKTASIRFDTNVYSVGPEFVPPNARTRKGSSPSSPATPPCACSTAIPRSRAIPAAGGASRSSSCPSTATPSCRPSAAPATARGATDCRPSYPASTPSSSAGSAPGATSAGWSPRCESSSTSTAPT